MSCSAYIQIELLVAPTVDEAEVAKWNRKAGTYTYMNGDVSERDLFSTKRDKDGWLLLGYENDASWLDGEMEELAHHMSSFPSEPGEWVMEVHYDFFDEPNSDGSVVHIRIENGKIASFQESVIVMEEARPWVKFELEEES